MPAGTAWCAPEAAGASASVALAMPAAQSPQSPQLHEGAKFLPAAASVFSEVRAQSGARLRSTAATTPSGAVWSCALLTSCSSIGASLRLVAPSAFPGWSARSRVGLA